MTRRNPGSRPGPDPLPPDATPGGWAADWADGCIVCRFRDAALARRAEALDAGCWCCFVAASDDVRAFDDRRRR